MLSNVYIQRSQIHSSHLVPFHTMCGNELLHLRSAITPDTPVLQLSSRKKIILSFLPQGCGIYLLNHVVEIDNIGTFKSLHVHFTQIENLRSYTTHYHV